MSHPVLEAEIVKLVKTLEEIAASLQEETSLLQRTIAFNRADIYGMNARISTIQEMTKRLGRLGAKLDAFHDLRYKILAGSVDPGEGSAVEEPCPPTKPPPPPPSTRPSPAGRRSTRS